MERSTSSERAAAFGRYNDHEPVRDCIGVDEKWEHQRVCEGACRSKSVGACMFLSKILILLITDNRVITAASRRH